MKVTTRAMTLAQKAYVLRPDERNRTTALGRIQPALNTLRVAGGIDAAPRVAIVGTRRCDPQAERFAERLARELALSGVVIVSGGARGIDAAAHRGALEAQGRTIAVLASGLRDAYPPEHRDLFEEIAQSGAVVTETDDDTRPLRFSFLRRNRIIAALADVVVVVQAPRKSGALSTAAAAARLKVPVFAVPSSPWDPRSEGSNGLLASGKAEPLRSSAALWPILGLEGRPRAPSSESAPEVSSDARNIWSHLSASPRHIDELAELSELDPSRVQVAMTELLLVEAAVAHPDGRFSRL